MLRVKKKKSATTGREKDMVSEFIIQEALAEKRPGSSLVLTSKGEKMLKALEGLIRASRQGEKS